MTFCHSHGFSNVDIVECDFSSIALLHAISDPYMSHWALTLFTLVSRFSAVELWLLIITQVK